MKRILTWLAVATVALAIGAGGQARVVNRLGGADFTNIKDALNAATLNEIIQINAAGNPYPDEGLLTVGQSVTLTSINGIAVIQRTRFNVLANNVTFQNLSLDGENASKQIISFLGVSNATVRGCTVVNPASGTVDSPADTTDDLADVAEAMDCGVCVSVAGGDNVLIENNDMRSTANSAIASQANVQVIVPGAGTHNGLTIRGNQFGAETRNLSIWSGWSNVTIENNSFVRATLGTVARTGSNILISTLNSDGAAVCRNWTIRNNTFTFADDSNISFEQCTVDNIDIEGNTFTQAQDNQAVILQAVGSGVVVRNNTFGTSGSTAVSLNNALNQPAANALATVTVSDNHMANPAAGVSVGENVSQGIVVRDNVIDAVGANVGMSLTGGSASALLQRNRVSQGGSSSCINLDGLGATVVDCEFIGGRRGVALFSQNTFTSVGGNNIVARNLVVEPGLSGTSGRIVGIGDWDNVTGWVAQANNRIIGNTVVLCAADGIYVAGPGYKVYNNISAFCVNSGINVKAGVTLALSDYNLYFQNQVANYVGTTAGPHDIAANPQFVTFFGVSAGADFHLKPISPARDAGTSNGVDPDYITDLGALQDVAVDTAVPGAAWELYR